MRLTRPLAYLQRFLRQPTPLNLEAKQDLAGAFLTGLFVFLFLLVFQPFGLSGNEPKLKYGLMAGYGFVSFVVITLNLVFVPKCLKKTFEGERWTVARQVLWYLWIVLAVGMANFLFACLVNSISPFFRLGFDAVLYFLYFQLMTLVVALFPIVFWTVLGQARRLRLNLRAAEEISEKIQARGHASQPARDTTAGRPVVLVAENGKDRYSFSAGDILFIVAEGNYVEVFEKGEAGKTVLIRSSLKKIEKQLKDYPFLVRCHRAYMVNMTKIQKAAGNAQGLKLALEDTVNKVPVARRYTRSVQERLGIL